jgi:ribosomal protein S18 acetylase RimI-like enzyme
MADDSVRDATVEVREATTSDAAGIARVHVHSWQAAYRGLIDDEFLDALDQAARTDAWRRSIEGRLGTVLVGLVDDEVVGFAALMPSRDPDAPQGCGEVTAIYLEPEAWDQGLGRLLMDASLDRLADQGFTEVSLWVLRGNERAIRFYERSGFQADGAEKVDDTRGFPLDELRYRRTLPA